MATMYIPHFRQENWLAVTIQIVLSLPIDINNNHGMPMTAPSRTQVRLNNHFNGLSPAVIIPAAAARTEIIRPRPN